MGTIATLLGLLVVTTPVAVEVCDVAGCRVQPPNTFGAGCRVAVYASVAAQDVTRARWTVTAHRVDGTLEAVTVTRDFGSSVLWGGSQAYWTSGLVSPTRTAGWLAVHARDAQGCVTDTRIELSPPA